MRYLSVASRQRLIRPAPTRPDPLARLKTAHAVDCRLGSTATTLPVPANTASRQRSAASAVSPRLLGVEPALEAAREAWGDTTLRPWPRSFRRSRSPPHARAGILGQSSCSRALRSRITRGLTRRRWNPPNGDAGPILLASMITMLLVIVAVVVGLHPTEARGDHSPR